MLSILKGALMNDIETLRKAIKRKHPCDEVHAALNRIEKFINAISEARTIDEVHSLRQLAGL